MFGRATITLGIGPHSSSYCFRLSNYTVCPLGPRSADSNGTEDGFKCRGYLLASVRHSRCSSSHVTFQVGALERSKDATRPSQYPPARGLRHDFFVHLDVSSGFRNARHDAICFLLIPLTGDHGVEGLMSLLRGVSRCVKKGGDQWMIFPQG